MKKLTVISTSLRPGSNGHAFAEQFAEGAKAASMLFCSGVNDPHAIAGNPKLQEAYELGRKV